MSGNKYSTEFKQKVVQHYLDSDDGLKKTAKLFGIDHGAVRRWLEHWKVSGVHFAILENQIKKAVRETETGNTKVADSFARQIESIEKVSGSTAKLTAIRENLTQVYQKGNIDTERYQALLEDITNRTSGLEKVVGTGAYSGNQVGIVADISAKMEKAVGQDIDKTIEHFKRLDMRVEMPPNSIYNQKQAEAERLAKIEAERLAQEEAKSAE